MSPFRRLACYLILFLFAGLQVMGQTAQDSTASGGKKKKKKEATTTSSEEASAPSEKKKKEPSASATEKKVKKLVAEGDAFYYGRFDQTSGDKFTGRQTVLAEKKYKEAINLDPNNYYIIKMIGRCNDLMGNVQEAIDWYTAAIQAYPDATDTIYFDLGVNLRKMGRCYDAKENFNIFLKKHTTDDELTKQARFEMEGCDFIAKQKDKQAEYFTYLMEFNTENNENFPYPYTVKGDSFIVFTSDRMGTVGSKNKKRRWPETGLPYTDIWTGSFSNDSTVGEIENIGKRVNTKANDGSGCVDPTGTIIYYTICGKGKYRRVDGCSIYFSEFNVDAKQWGKYQKLEGINSDRERVVNNRGKTKKVPTYDAHPMLSPDGNTMYFVSDREGGYGELDVWYATKMGSVWSNAVNVGPTVNSEFSELSPFLGQDGKTLYFASNGHLGYGGYDLFKSDGKGSNWNEPVNLGAPINSTFDDISLVWTIQDSTGFFASNRPNGKGRDDIYWMRKIYKPSILITVQGYVRDKKTKQVVPFATVTRYEVLDNGQLAPIDTFRTDQSGYYQFSLEQNKNYKFVGIAPEYLANEVEVSTKDITKTTTLEADIDIFLDRIDLNRPIVLQNIYYDFDSSALRPESVSELNRLIKILTDNPSISILLSSHTDTNGSEAYNLKLSNRRAKSVLDYLLTNGVDGERLTSFGFGESRPLVYPELSDADEQANRRTEFRINSLNWKPKKKK
jgi:peptidoglycan-associated lipoprotein